MDINNPKSQQLAAANERRFGRSKYDLLALSTINPDTLPLVCGRCHQEKYAYEFHRANTARGRQRWCKECYLVHRAFDRKLGLKRTPLTPAQLDLFLALNELKQELKENKQEDPQKLFGWFLEGIQYSSSINAALAAYWDEE